MTVYVVMGVSGSGKTTVGKELAKRLNCPFYDADDYHPAENVEKMASGQPLNDDDRAPWLATLREVLAGHVDGGETAVLACSALKQAYRDKLQVNGNTQFVFLDGSFDLIWGRMRQRKNHYMKADMLQSQFDALEPPNEDEAIVVNIEQAVDQIVTAILSQIKAI